MSFYKLLTYITVFLFCTSIKLFSQELEDTEEKKDSQKAPANSYFDYAIRAFEKEDKKKFPAVGAIVCIGSSSMRFWHDTIEEDLAPLTIIPRGFGGSDMSDALLYVNRIVTPYKPRAVVIYEGENDIVMGVKPKKVAEDFKEFAAKIHKELPETRIYFLSIKPSVGRWYLWPQLLETNKIIEKDCLQDKRLIYVDLASAMFDSESKPRPELFGRDGYHLSKAGYVVWTNTLKPILLKTELAFEAITKKTEKEDPQKITPLKPKEENK